MLITGTAPLIIRAESSMASSIDSNVYDLTLWTSRKDQAKNNWNAGIKRIVDANGSNVTIYIPRGTYTQDKQPWNFAYDNITIQGDGSPTILKGARRSAGSAQTVVKNNFGRYRGWEVYSPWGLSKAEKGNNYLELLEVPDNISVGDIIFVCAGANGVDPDYGEYNIVTSISNTRLNLQYILSRTYSLDVAPYHYTTTADFIMPPLGGSVNITISPRKSPSHPIKYNSTSRPYVNIGNNLLQVISTDVSRLTVKNTGKAGNSAPGTTIQKGTKFVKAVCVYKCSMTPRNVALKNFHIEDDDHVRALDAGHSVGTRITNVTMSGAYTTGNNYPQGTDTGRDIIFDSCIFTNTTGVLVGHPASRSCGDITYRNCTFTNVAAGAGEFSHGATFDKNRMMYDITENRGVTYVVSLGSTTKRVIFTNNTISVKGVDYVFSNGDVSTWISDSGIDNTDPHIIDGNKITGGDKGLCTPGAIREGRIHLCTPIFEGSRQ